MVYDRREVYDFAAATLAGPTSLLYNELLQLTNGVTLVGCDGNQRPSSFADLPTSPAYPQWVKPEPADNPTQHRRTYTFVRGLMAGWDRIAEAPSRRSTVTTHVRPGRRAPAGRDLWRPGARFATATSAIANTSGATGSLAHLRHQARNGARAGAPGLPG